jgi:magnesium-dependent phosphatase 1
MLIISLSLCPWESAVDTPIKRKGDALNKVVDRYGTTMSLFPHVPSILFYLRSQNVVIAAASRTSAPSAARQALQGLVIIDDSIPPVMNVSTRQSQIIPSRTPVKAISLFTQQEIYPGSKLTHFKSLHAKTGIPYEEMLFFDDE